MASLSPVGSQLIPCTAPPTLEREREGGREKGRGGGNKEERMEEGREGEKGRDGIKEGGRGARV